MIKAKAEKLHLEVQEAILRQRQLLFYVRLKRNFQRSSTKW